MKILSAEFVTGAAHPSQFPASVLPEVAFAGKSNVGKSSLIGALLGRKRLVKISSTPGKTREINFFLVNGAFFFVDLPGYGYAQAPKHVQRGWQALLEAYLTGRNALRGAVLIVDARHDPGPLDVQMKVFLAAHRVPILVVAHKADKLPRGRLPERLNAVARALELPQPPLACSSRTGEGRDALWALLAAWLTAPAREHPRVQEARP